MKMELGKTKFRPGSKQRNRSIIRMRSRIHLSSHNRNIVEPDREPEEGAEDQRRGVHGGDGPNPYVLPGEMPNYQAWITPNGTRYHTARDCVTLAQTRRIFRSEWCELCGPRLPIQRYGEIYVARLGENAHHNINCPNIGLRLATTYQCCQRCPRLPRNLR